MKVNHLYNLDDQETFRLVQSINWSKHPLGLPDQWPTALKTILNVVLNSRQPSLILWGPEAFCFYNDAYIPILGNQRHPDAMGQRGCDTWSDVWATVNPKIHQIINGGRSIWREDDQIQFLRNGFIQDAYFTSSYSPILLEDGKIGGTLVTCFETTRRVVAENNLTAREERLRSILDNAAVGFVLINPAGILLEVNRAFSKMMGYAEGELVGTSMQNLVHPDDRVTSLGSECTLQTSSEKSFSIEKRHVRKDGTVFWGRCVISPKFDPSGTLVHLSAVVEDITEKVLAAERLSESEAKFRTIANAMPQIVWSTLPNGYHDYFNDRWYEFSGASPGATDGEVWKDLYHPEDRDRAWKIWQHSLRTGEPYQIEYRLRHKSGQFRWTLGRALPIRDDNGAIIRWMGTCTDIEETIQAQRELVDTIESMSDSFLSIDKDWKITRVNARHEATTNIKREDQLGRSLLELFFSDPIYKESKYLKAYHEAMEKRVFITFEDYYEPLELWTEVRVYPKNDGGLAIFFTDISERKRTESQLALEKQKLEAMIALAPAGIALLKGPEFRFEKVNTKFTELVSPRPYLGKTWSEVYPELADSQLLGELRRVYETGQPYSAVEMKVHVEAEADTLMERYYDVDYSRTVDEEGQPYGVCIQSSDVTDRVHTRRKIEESSERLRLALEGGRMGTWRITFPDHILSVDEKFREIHGVAYAQEHIEEAIDRAAHPEDREVIREAVRCALRDGNPYECEYRTKAADGSYHWIHAHGKAKYDGEGNPISLTGVALDITERRKSQARLRTIVDTFPTFAGFLDTSGVITFLNQSAMNTIGDSQEVILQKKFWDCPWWNSLPEIQERIKQAVYCALSGKPQRFDTQYVSIIDGKQMIRWVDLSLMRVLADDGRVEAVTASGFDITDRVEQSKQLTAAKAEAENANHLKSAFLANMSHEIRTPLGVMIGFSDLITDESIDPQEKRQFSQTLKRNGEQLTLLINDILDLSKVESGYLKIEMIEFSLRAVVDDVLAAMRVKAAAKGLELQLKIDQNVNDRIESDPTRLRQILFNLIGNAVKFTQAGRVKLLIRESLGHLQLEIQDTGIGIPAEHSAALFKPFSQGDESMTRKFGGTGLGLALSKRLAHLLGGNLVLKESRVGHGSTFLLSIKTCSTVADRQPRPELALPSTAGSMTRDRLDGISVLLVEDSPDNQHLISMFLTKSGATVDCACNGEEGVDMAFRGSHDLVLMDVQMPVLDGYSATQRLREAGFQKPIVALTAHAMNEVRQRCMDVGCTDHLPKPINPKQLIHTIAKHVQAERGLLH